MYFYLNNSSVLQVHSSRNGCTRNVDIPNGSPTMICPPKRQLLPQLPLLLLPENPYSTVTVMVKVVELLAASSDTVHSTVRVAAL